VVHQRLATKQPSPPPQKNKKAKAHLPVEHEGVVHEYLVALADGHVVHHHRAGEVQVDDALEGGPVGAEGGGGGVGGGVEGVAEEVELAWFRGVGWGGIRGLLGG
jgi:uncharacterized membrane protein